MERLWFAFWELSVEMGIYILAGLFIAGVLHQWVREASIRRHLGSATQGAVYKAALAGIPLPLCSCSVIPFAVSLRRSGASRGATLSFLISTPITGADSILATFGMFGGAFTFYRVVSSGIMAVAAGLLMNRFDSPESKPAVRFGITPPVTPSSPIAFRAPEPTAEVFSFKKVFVYGFDTLLGSFSKPLFWGLAAGAVISAFLPENLHTLFAENRILGYGMAVAIAVPMYVCATASLPIAASLILAGVSPGAAFVFLSAGPATNTVTIGVVKSLLGTRALIIYLSTIVIGSVAFGAAIDLALDSMALGMAVDMSEEHSLIEQGSAVVLLGLIGWHTVRGWFTKTACCENGSCRS